QQQIPFSDGSALRLTIARYYTPSGRSIQKEYKMGDSKDYEMDILNRYEHGEFYSQDSIHMKDTLKYKTKFGRTVYGGGGIMPDIFVARDTTGNSSYLASVVNNGLIYQFAFKYADENRNKLTKLKEAKDILKYLRTQPVLNDFVKFAATKGVKPRPVYINLSRKVITNNLYAYIARNIIGDEAFYPIILMDDNTFIKAVELLDNNKGFPVVKKDGKE
ncbi:MAG: peptidase S41, partial [Bacteroidales bacterium]